MKLGEKGYMIDWHQLPKTTSLDLLFFIRVCQFPAKISAGKIVVLSMSTFSTVKFFLLSKSGKIVSSLLVSSSFAEQSVNLKMANHYNLVPKMWIEQKIDPNF